MKLKILLFFTLAILVITILLGIGVHLSYSTKNDFLQNTPLQVWAHRGGGNLDTPNSIAGIKRAIYAGVTGLEIDIFFDKDLNDFVVSHNKPYDKIADNIQKLSQVLSFYPQKLYLWLDFKNLSLFNAKHAIIKLNYLMQKYKLDKNKIIIESTNWYSLRDFSQESFQTCFWPNISQHGHIQRLRVIFTRAIIGFSNFSAISAHYENYQRTYQKYLSDIPTMVFTVNDLKTMEEFKTKNNVKVILSDHLFLTK